jgi:extradiol dioxygenase family protein
VKLTPFHIAVQVRDLVEARAFYGGVLGLDEGRSSSSWIDFNMYGHQFVVHLNEGLGANGSVQQIKNPVDGQGVPVPHCGVVLEFEQWRALAERLTGVIDSFVVEPYVRFAGEVGEQGTFFFLDPSGNALEFKGFRDIERDLFAS